MRSAAQRKVDGLGEDPGNLLQGQFHTFYMDNPSDVAKLGNLLDRIA